MRARKRSGARPRWVFRPRVECPESRDLLSGIIASMAGNGPLGGRSRGLVETRQTNSAFAPPTTPADRFVSPPGTPTAATLARTRFHASFAGPYHVGPGRTSAESAEVYVRGGGRSNFFLHGTTQLRFIVPRDTSLAPVGTIVLLDRNVNNSGQLGLDLTAVPGSADALGRVRRFTWTVDDSYSAGVFTNAAGQGTLEVKYGPVPGRGHIGRASLIIRGRVLTQGIGDPTTNASLDS